MDWNPREVFDEVVAKPANTWEQCLSELEAKGCPRAIRDEVQNLLDIARATTTGGARVDSDRIRGAAERAVMLGSLQEVGPYRVVRVLNRGGFGVVYIGEQTQPIQRSVAIKVLDPGRATPPALRQFEFEREALSRLQHPNIASLLDAGQTPWGQTYIVMELITVQRGEERTPAAPIVRYCDEQRLGIRARLELFREVCHAVQHAHARGIIHRDLKPSNILVAEVEGRPVPKVIDFGIARLNQQAGDTATAEATQAGSPLGSLAYMSPEQAKGSRDINVQSDVYSLGVVLYELLTGLCPLELEGQNEARVLQAIIAGETVAASARLSARSRSAIEATAPEERGAEEIATLRGMTAIALERTLRRELEWIPRMAMAVERERRYATVAELSEDVRRYLAGEPLVAGPESRWYLARKFVQKHRTAVLASAAVLVAIVAALVVTMVALDRVRKANATANLRLTTSERMGGLLTDVLRHQLGDADGARPGVLAASLEDAIANLIDSTIDTKIKASVVSSLVQCFMDLQMSDEARRTSEKAYRLAVSAWPPDDPHVLLAASSKAFCSAGKGRPEHAQALEELWTIYKTLGTVAGSHARETLYCASNIASLQCEDGDWKGVANLLAPLVIDNNIADATSQLAALLRLEYGYALVGLGKAEGFNWLVRAADDYMGHLGANDSTALDARVAVVQAYFYAGRNTDARDYALVSLKSLERAGGSGAPEIAHFVSQVFQSSPDLVWACNPDSLSLGSKAIRSAKKCEAVRPLWALEAYDWGAMAQEANGLIDESIETSRAFADLWRRARPKQGSEVILRIADRFKRLGYYAEALRTLDDAEARFRDDFGQGPGWLYKAMFDRIRLYQSVGDPLGAARAAESAHQEALALRYEEPYVFALLAAEQWWRLRERTATEQNRLALQSRVRGLVRVATDERARNKGASPQEWVMDTVRDLSKALDLPEILVEWEWKPTNPAGPAN